MSNLENNLKINPIWLWQAPQICLLIFLFLVISAAFLYPGGTLHDAEMATYSFSNNYLSDMGRTIAINGEANFFASSFFLIALTIAGLVIMLFFINARVLFKDTKTMRILALIGTITGILGCLSLIGVGFTPVNLYREPHIFAANWVFRFFFVASLCYTFAIFLKKEMPNKLAIGYLIFSIFIISYILINELGPSPHTSPQILTIKVMAQKIILLCFIATIYLQSVGIKKIYGK